MLYTPLNYKVTLNKENPEYADLEWELQGREVEITVSLNEEAFNAFIKKFGKKIEEAQAILDSVTHEEIYCYHTVSIEERTVTAVYRPDQDPTDKQECFFLNTLIPLVIADFSNIINSL